MMCRNLRTCLLVTLVLTAGLPPVPARLGGAFAVRTARAQTKVKNPHGEFKEDCSLCHRATGWKPAQISKKFDHEAYGIPLTGAHATVACMQCHTSLDFGTASAACIDCHADVHNAELGTDCARCHGTRSFIDRNDQIRMHRLTRFPLAGAHQTLDCEMCHRLAAPGSLSYVNTASDCASCHMSDYDATVAPDHAAAGFSTDCAACHSELAWTRVNFDHAQTAFPLTGAHLSLACERCHVGGVFTGLSSDCYSCHQQDYETATPDHGGFPTQCQDCHNTRGWTGANFNHASTGFALTGAHNGLPCADCHVGGVYTGLSAQCASCHQSDFDSTNDPNHAAAGFTTDCTACHNTTRWDGATFDHNQWFPINSGAHRGEWNACSDCHINPASYAQFSCLGCHPHSDRNETDNKHQGENGYSYDSNACYNCHPNGRS